MLKAAIALLLVLTIFISVTAIFLPEGRPNHLASVFFSDSVTPDSLKIAYTKATGNSSYSAPTKVRILIVPGHDDKYFGTQFLGLKEHDLTVDLGEKLYNLLKREPAFDVHITQTKDGFTPEFASYFENNRDSVMKFINDQKGLMQHYVQTGQIATKVNVIHNNAAPEVAYRLYAINKWADDNHMDIVIHAHFNDIPNRPRNRPGKYSGFAIYVPDGQYSNAKGSKSVADSIYKRLESFYAQSDLPKEDTGVVPDQDLIAIGANNSLDSAGMLIEYSYIYEPTVTNPASREITLSDMALQTYLGVLDFFGKKSDAGGKFGSRLLPHTWQADLQKSQNYDPNVLSLQAALALQSFYPPPDETKNDCPMTGNFGPCTQKAVANFQEKYGIQPAQGYVGGQTRAKLNALYSN